MAGGRVFGTSDQVSLLAQLIKQCMEGISSINQNAIKLLSVIEGSESDTVYQQATEIVNYVAKAVEMGQEPLQDVTSNLYEYASLLAQHGR